MTLRYPLRRLLAAVILLLMQANSNAQNSEIVEMDLPEGDIVDVRLFAAREGDKLLLGLACDEGVGETEMKVAALLADSAVEVWMPDLLSAHFLPKLNSSLDEIPAEDVVTLINKALASPGKRVFLISSGHCSKVLLRGLAAWEQQNPDRLNQVHGVVLLYPRLNAKPPVPGEDPVFIDAVGKTRTPIIILEGERTPNSWALPMLKNQMEAGGSRVATAVIPGVRGFFYEREKQSLPEDIVTDQLAGLVRAAVVKLEMLVQPSN